MEHTTGKSGSGDNLPAMMAAAARADHSPAFVFPALMRGETANVYQSHFSCCGALAISLGQRELRRQSGHCYRSER
jgi:hypothetical protein